MAEPDPPTERDIDETLEETFPASDPPSHTGETGVQIGPPGDEADLPVTDNNAAQRYELTVEGATAFLKYERSADRIALVHTEVPEHLRGRHLGERLVEVALERAKADGLTIVAVCPFVRSYMRRHHA